MPYVSDTVSIHLLKVKYLLHTSQMSVQFSQYLFFKFHTIIKPTDIAACFLTLEKYE